MKPREMAARPARHPKDEMAISVRQNAAENEMLFKTNQKIVDTMRHLGRKSGNMLMRVAMMDDNPIFANGTDLPSSLTNKSFAQSGYPETMAVPKQDRGDLVKGGKGDDVFLVSRGVVPSVIPAKYSSAKGRYIATHATTMKDTYPDHAAEHARAIAAKNAGQAQAKDWQHAAQRKQNLEMELDALDAALTVAEGGVNANATRHGLFGRSTKDGPFAQPDDAQRNSQHIEGCPPLLGLTPLGGTTMKDTYTEHSSRKRMVFKNQQVYGGMRYSLLAPESDDPNMTFSPRKPRNTQNIGKYKNVTIPHDPSALTKKLGSEVCGSSFRWKNTIDQSKNSEVFSWPSDKLVDYDHDKQEMRNKHKYGSYDISKTRYGNCAKEIDHTNGHSVFVMSKKDIARHNKLSM